LEEIWLSCTSPADQDLKFVYELVGMRYLPQLWFMILNNRANNSKKNEFYYSVLGLSYDYELKKIY
jgi:hypothetical protein